MYERTIRDQHGNVISRATERADGTVDIRDTCGNVNARIVQRGGRDVIVDNRGNVIGYVD